MQQSPAEQSREPRFGFLLIGLLISLILGPVVDEFTTQGPKLWLAVFFTATVMVAVFSFTESRGVLIAGLTLGLISLLGTGWLALAPDSELAPLMSELALLLFCCIALFFTLKYLFKRGRVTVNRIVGAISVYLLAGVALSLVNILIHESLPGSYSGIGDDPGTANGSNMIYYTFVTLTTLGYGDITPQRPLAQAIAYLTAVTGQFYIAILVAWVIGSYLAQPDD